MKHIPRKRFGQHFLVDETVIYRIIQLLGSLKEPAHIVEIGPGKGALTFQLLESIKNANACFSDASRFSQLSAIEIDRDLIDYLNSKTQNQQAAEIFKIYSADVLKFDFDTLKPPIRIIGNLPYNITTPLLFYLLDYKTAIKDMLFMLQKEVVTRLCAVPHTKEYGRLSVMMQSEFELSHCFDVPRQSFNPPPAVESAIVKLIPKENHFPHKDQFKKLVQVFFSHRRKTVKNLLGMLKLEPEKMLKCSENIDLSARPENLSVDDFRWLSSVFSSEKKQGR